MKLKQLQLLMKFWTNRLYLILIFTGSVFLTSGRFVNATNVPKFYFVVLSLLLTTAFTAVSQKRLNFSAIKNKTILWGVSIVCFVQACYGLWQFVGWFPSNHSKFAITGSFDNPAGFVALLSMGFPVGLFLLSETKKFERCLAVAGLMIIILSVILSGSRTGVLAILISSLVFFLFQTNMVSRFRQFKFYKLLPTFALTFLFTGTLILYDLKKDSANGRLLIWKVSSEMIKEKPILGHGYGAFQAKYMDYQAEYFKANPASKFVLLADNIKHPFNEFIKVAVEFGMIGLFIALSIILFVLRKIMKLKNKNSQLVLSGLASFMVFACFSYPLQYVAVWLLLAFYLSALLPLKEIEIKNTPISIIMKSVIIIVCVFSLFHTYKQIRAEMKWKTIAINSLRGDTEKMLPEYERLYSTLLKRNPFFLYNYGAELNIAGRFDKSINILTECKKRFNDYDLQMLMADNYYKKDESEKAIQTYQHASNMIPCRFLPIYRLFEIYRKQGQKDMAMKYANEIINKKVKIRSSTVASIKSKAEEYLKENKSTFGNN
ncbi:MAG: O-antigen ligase family protein [Mangrovibacterium sp.]